MEAIAAAGLLRGVTGRYPRESIQRGFPRPHWPSVIPVDLGISAGVSMSFWLQSTHNYILTCSL